jgi:hypothetical protein
MFSVGEDALQEVVMSAIRGVVGGVGLGLLLCGGYLMASSEPQAGQAAVPTFSKDVAPILYKNCTGCHRPGEIGPMPLLTYDDARPYATAIKDEVQAGHMPPWHAAAPAGMFLNERRLSDADKQTLFRWVEGGAPRGNDRDLPPKPAYPDGWTIGTPDAVFPMPTAYAVPASGTIPYQYFEVPTNFTEDKWIQALEIRPGTRAVVHHVLLYAREPEGSGPPRTRVLTPRRDGTFPQPAAAPAGAPAAPPAAPPAGAQPQTPPRRLGALIGATAPGTNATMFRPGAALQIRAGAVLTFQIHYTANGVAATDRSTVGIVFAKTPPTAEVRAASFINARLAIPAGAANHQVDAEVTFAEDALVWGLLPHTHLRGTKWEYRLVYPDGRTESILSVPRYDFNWQTYYMFAKPLAVPKGARIESSAWYDNSAANPSNPDPKKDVRWGDQTWEEMQYTGILYSTPAPAAAGKGSR